MMNYSPQSESPNTSTEEISLPTDLWIEIFKRLPFQSLGRSACVCKSWFSILKSSTFHSVLVNLNLRNDSSKKLLLFKNKVDLHNAATFTRFLVRTTALSYETEFECKIGRSHFVVSSAHGLICLFDFYCKNPEKSPLILWNPSIWKALTVPIPVHVDGLLELTQGGFPKVIFGLGFDSCSDGYMVVRAAYYYGRGGESRNTIFRVHVYNVSDCTWRDLGKIPVPLYINTIRWRGVCLNGIIHWICNVVVNSDVICTIQQSILTFNLRNGQFGEIKLPEDLVGDVDQTLNPLRVVMVPRGGEEVLGVVLRVEEFFSLWVMEEYGVMGSWVELLGVDFDKKIKNDLNIVVLSDQFVVAQLEPRIWVSYDLKTEMATQMGMNHMKFGEKFDLVDTYVENLTLLGQQNGALPAKEVQPAYTKGRSGRRRKGIEIPRSMSVEW